MLPIGVDARAAAGKKPPPREPKMPKRPFHGATSSSRASSPNTLKNLGSVPSKNCRPESAFLPPAMRPPADLLPASKMVGLRPRLRATSAASEPAKPPPTIATFLMTTSRARSGRVVVVAKDDDTGSVTCKRMRKCNTRNRKGAYTCFRPDPSRGQPEKTNNAINTPQRGMSHDTGGHRMRCVFTKRETKKQPRTV